ncbi:MAG TPA: hypothetical protein VFI41_05435 [Gemmatimonadales bacterium]|nr:hypothetical protein [Gemmatimonadales bacterium]
MSLESIIDKARLVFRDYGEAFQARVAGDGASQRFDLPTTNVDAATLNVWIDDGGPTPNTLTPTTGPPAAGEYLLEPRGGTITVGDVIAQGTVLVVDGVGALFTLVEDLSPFVEIAFDLHTQGRYPPITIDELSATEELMVALLAVRESLWAEVAEHGHQVDVTTPEGMHIPGGQAFNQLMQMIEIIENRYRELSTRLGIGLYAISQDDLRRVSRTTNRLVPLYWPREFDDISPPVRKN